MWADLVAWFQSPGGARVLQTAIVPAVAILVAGVLAALIGRAAVRAAIGRADRDQAGTAVAALVEAVRAAVEDDGGRDGRRRRARLRTEADVRVRLLPLPGAALAADWAAARTEELQQRSEGAGAGLDGVRDRLIDWVRRPRKAKRLFPSSASTGAPGASPLVTRAERGSEAPVTAPADEQPERSTPAAAAGPVPEGRVESAPQPVAAASLERPAPEPVVPVAAVDEESVPAWRRTRAGERLQQERGVSRQPGRPAEPQEDESGQTTPVRTQQAHRAAGLPVTDAEDAVEVELHQQARHASPEDHQPQPPAPDAARAEPENRPAVAVSAEAAGTERSTDGTPAARRTPAWLDDYDDEAQVTQNMDLRTPPPVAANSVRDRTPSGEDIVPRT